MHRILVTVAFHCLGAGGVALGQVPLGPDFLVNAHTAGAQFDPVVVAAPSGEFVVVWNTAIATGDAAWDVRARRFDSNGAAMASELLVSAYTLNNQLSPAAAMRSDGSFVIVWSSQDHIEDNVGVFGQRFDSSGARHGTEFAITAFTYSGKPRIAMRGDGDFVVVWERSGGGVSADVFGRRFDSSGGGLGEEFLVNSHTVETQGSATVASSPAGDFVVAWYSSDQDGSGAGIFSRRFDSLGNALASEFQVSTYTLYNQFTVDAAIAADGAFVIAWSTLLGPDADTGTFGQRFDSSGQRLGAPFRVAGPQSSGDLQPAIAIDVDGSFVVAWSTNNYEDGSLAGVFARRFDSSGVRQGPDFQVNAYTWGHQQSPSVAFGAAGTFVVAWYDHGRYYGHLADVLARRFESVPGSLLDVDGSGDVDALTDATLLLRRRFGFDGDLLISVALATDCSRCQASDVESYLDAIEQDLDVDGDGVVGPLTDALLVLRWLFGLSGEALTSGAVGANCSRCTGDEIETFLLNL